jgi:hypothetical protein
MRPTRNNRGIAHENGSIESPHGHFKRRLHQALLLRGSFDFDSVDSYQQLLEQVVVSLNRRCAAKFGEEKEQLQPLPEYPFADYEILSVRVTCHSTITVRCILYTVPSQLIGHRLTIHLYHDRLLVFASYRHHRHRNPQSFIEVSQTATHEPLLARIGTNGAATGMDSRPVSTSLVRIRSDAAISSESATGT